MNVHILALEVQFRYGEGRFNASVHYIKQEQREQNILTERKYQCVERIQAEPQVLSTMDWL